MQYKHAVPNNTRIKDQEAKCCTVSFFYFVLLSAVRVCLTHYYSRAFRKTIELSGTTQSPPRGCTCVALAEKSSSIACLRDSLETLTKTSNTHTPHTIPIFMCAI